MLDKAFSLSVVFCSVAKQRRTWVRKLQRGYRRLSGQGISIGSILLLGIAAIVGYYTLGWLGVVIGAIVGLLLTS